MKQPGRARTRLLQGGALLLGAWMLAYAVARLVPADASPPLFDERLDPARIDSVAIAPSDEALSFARMPGIDGGPPRLLRVLRYQGGVVSGLDLAASLPAGADAVAAHAALGLDGLAALSGPPVEVPATALLAAFETTAVQVAAGINYPEHGQEVQVEETFVFPKPTSARPPRTAIEGRWELLDYEVELGFVALAPVVRGAPLPTLGLVLVADYTDRAALLRHLRIADVASGDGFSFAKGEPGFMPVGDLFVIPRDLGRFVAALELRLWLNGRLRQRAEPKRLTWPIERIVAETFARAGHAFQGGPRIHRLPVANDTIPARTLFLSGTPDGVLFQGVSARQRFLGGSELVSGLHGWHLRALMEPYIRESLAGRHYLQPGDEVVMHADRLGAMVHRIGTPVAALR